MAKIPWTAVLTVLLAILGSGAPGPLAQSQDGLPDPVPPPLPRRPVPDDASTYRAVIDDSDVPWEIPDSLLAALAKRAAVYQKYSREFTCDEEVRRAEYNESGEAHKERSERYAYTLLQDASGQNLREYRQEFTRKGDLKRGEVLDEEPFPPAYGWVYLFSERNQPLFSYRHIAKRFEGFDLVHEIQFRGALPFNSGKDIRQWEGTVLVDALTYAPIEVEAEPAGQRARIVEAYNIYNKSFNILGFRTKPKPQGYRAHVEFSHLRGALRFPTRLRYDTHQAVSVDATVPISASTRRYGRYRFTDVGVEEDIGDVVEEP